MDYNDLRPKSTCPKCGTKDAFSAFDPTYVENKSQNEYLEWACYTCGFHLRTPVITPLTLNATI